MTAKPAASPLAGAASHDSTFASAAETESVEEAMVDKEVEAMADAEEEVVAASAKPKRSISDIDWTEAGFTPEHKKSGLAWVGVLALGAFGLASLLLLVPGASKFPSPPASLPPPRVKTTKSLNDLKIGEFVVNPRRSSDDLIVIAGDIENVSDNLHRDIRVELALLDAQGLKVITASEFITELGPRATWHVLAPATDPRVVSARLTEIKEDL